MNHPPRSRSLAVLAAAFLLLPSAFLLAQGPLTPPGAPAPVMKTLTQVEPRTPLEAGQAGVDTTNASYHFIINQPGSYYLSANLGVARTHGIQINAEGVTLDLNGFQISRASGTGGSGIEIPATSHRAAVRNGSLKGFEYGINSVQSGSFAKGGAFRDLAVSGCTLAGIYAGEGSVLEACRAHDNSGAYGIYAGPGSTLSHCTASGNTALTGIHASTGSTLSRCAAYLNNGMYGIRAGNGSTLSHCSAYGNGSSLATSAGISTAAGCAISHCTTFSNTSTYTPSTPTTGMGFNVGPYSTIEGCTAYANAGDGIKLSNNTLARANSCYGNGVSGDGAGIHAITENRIEANNVSQNDRGIDVDLTRNIILKNSASGNGSNYEIAANNVFGEIVNRVGQASAAVSGNTAASSTGTTDPWANFAY